MDLHRCLRRRWVHSHEEDTDTTSVYRPADAGLPPARGRTGFEFHPDGRVTLLGIAPADGTVESTGRWTVETGSVIRIDGLPGPGDPLVLTVLSCDDDRLVVER